MVGKKFYLTFQIGTLGKIINELRLLVPIREEKNF